MVAKNPNSNAEKESKITKESADKMMAMAAYMDIQDELRKHNCPTHTKVAAKLLVSMLDTAWKKIYGH